MSSTFNAVIFLTTLHISSKTILVIDSMKRIIAVLVGHPNDPEWYQVVSDSTKLMQEVQREGMELGVFLEKYVSHRRGDFLALPVGVSYGGGQTVGSPFIPSLHFEPC